MSSCLKCKYWYLCTIELCIEDEVLSDVYHCDYCRKVSKCEFVYETEGIPCNVFEVIDLD